MASYDNDARAKALLSGSAPTKQQIQEGYNTDILNATPVGAGKATTPGQAVPTTEVTNGYDHEKATPAAASKPTFLQSSKGKILIFILVLVAIAAIVGGAVGGTVGKNNNNNLQSSNSASSVAPSASATAGGASDGNMGDAAMSPISPTITSTSRTRLASSSAGAGGAGDPAGSCTNANCAAVSMSIR